MFKTKVKRFRITRISTLLATGTLFFWTGSLGAGELIPPVDPAASNFTLKCAGCHTIGRGKLTGPDLKDAILWPEKDLLPKIKLMEKHVGPLGLEEIHTFAQFLKDPKIQERLQAEEARIAKADEAKYEKGSEKIGAALFFGNTPFKKHGPACAACHTAGAWGGNFGPNLSKVFDKMGEPALISACEKGQFKVMDAAYRAHPLNRQEAIHLVKYLEMVSQGKVARDSGPFAVMTGAWAICFLSLGGMTVYYRKRTDGPHTRSKRG